MNVSRNEQRRLGTSRQDALERGLDGPRVGPITTVAMLLAGGVLTCIVGCSSGTDDASAKVTATAALPQASRNPSVTGVEQWVPLDVKPATGPEYVAFIGYEHGASDTDRKTPSTGKYAIVWQNGGDNHVTVGWADPTTKEPLQLSREQLQAFADDLKAIAAAGNTSPPTTSSFADETLRPQDLIDGVGRLLTPCTIDLVTTGAAAAGTLLMGAAAVMACTEGEVMSIGVDTPVCVMLGGATAAWAVGAVLGAVSAADDCRAHRQVAQ